MQGLFFLSLKNILSLPMIKSFKVLFRVHFFIAFFFVRRREGQSTWQNIFTTLCCKCSDVLALHFIVNANILVRGVGK